jgi:tetratricopeptide (TPR) repeat protein
MSSEDFIIRMIRQAMAVLTGIIGLKNAGQYQQARQQIDQALEALLGRDADFIRLLDDPSLYSLLMKEDALDLDALALIADLFKEEGDIHNLQDQKDAGLACYTRSLNYYLTVDVQSATPGPAELSQKITSLFQKIGADSLEADTLWHLYGHFEKERDFTCAEGILLSLAARSDSRADTLVELKCFYQRLLALSPADLTKGGLNREGIQQKLNDCE